MSQPRRLSLAHPQGLTSLLVGSGALAAAAPELAAWLAGRRAFVVTTPRVWSLHGAALGGLAETAAGWEVLPVAEGEEAKTLASAEALWRRMLEAGGKRDSRVLAFGGGSVGDLAGFVAGCFLRGVEVAQLPTTLLAQVDASIGGKTAVDLPEGKNSVGLFHHPAWVVADAAWLATLPSGELRAGLAEVIKVAAVWDAALFASVEGALEALLAGDPAALSPVVAAAVAAKVSVVEADPGDRGQRKILNFGHTLGHALETAGGYRELRHGEAVAWGMLFALRLARRRGFPADDAARLEAVIGRLGLPPLPALTAEALLDPLMRDKKAREAGLELVLPTALGHAEGRRDVTRDELATELRRFLAEVRGV